jgi:hypothetical protein
MSSGKARTPMRQQQQQQQQHQENVKAVRLAQISNASVVQSSLEINLAAEKLRSECRSVRDTILMSQLSLH